MSKILEYRRGQPDESGYWWLWPSYKFLKRTDFLPAGPRIVEVRMQNDIIADKPGLYMKYGNSRLEAELFEGRVAGPIPEPKMKR